jgi:hypothetical protein
MNDKEEEFVFVSLYVMLGDADSSIDGFAVLLKSDWEEEVSEFKKYLEKKKVEYLELEDYTYGTYDVNLDKYLVKPCTKEERAVFKEFFGKEISYGDFRLPLEFIEEHQELEEEEIDENTEYNK